MAAVENRHQSSIPEHVGTAECCSCKEAVGEDDACSAWSARSALEQHELGSDMHDGRDARSSHAMELLTDDLLLQVCGFVGFVSRLERAVDFICTLQQ